MKRFHPALALGLALALLFGLSGLATAATCASEYTVKQGDWIRQIARTFGVDWRAIVSANNLTNPDLIYPGQKLCIPPATTGTATTRTATATPTNKTQVATATPSATATGPTPTRTRTTTPAPSATPRPPVSVVVPTFRIVSVVRDQSVTIETANFPAGLKFDVRMGAMGTLGIGGTLVTTTDSGAGGTFQATYNIPAGLKGSDQIAIRLENLPSGYYSFNWFYNNNAP